MIIYEGTNNLVSGVFLKCFSIYTCSKVFRFAPQIFLDDLDTYILIRFIDYESVSEFLCFV